MGRMIYLDTHVVIFLAGNSLNRLSITVKDMLENLRLMASLFLGQASRVEPSSISSMSRLAGNETVPISPGKSCSWNSTGCPLGYDNVNPPVQRQSKIPDTASSARHACRLQSVRIAGSYCPTSRRNNGSQEKIKSARSKKRSKPVGIADEALP